MTTTHRRDALAAVGALVALVAAGLWTVGADPLVAPAGVATGVVGALVVEAVFLRYPDRLLSVWASTGVAVAGVVAVLLLGAGAVWVAPWVLGAVCWGLVTYLVLLGCVLAGGGNPLARVVAPRSGRE
jgi:hypothetical protein